MVDRRRLVDAYDDNSDFVQLAKDLGIARQTANSIIWRYRDTGEMEPGPRGGARRLKIDEDMIQYLLTQVERKPTITLKELQECMRTDLPAKPRVTHQAISKRLDDLMYTLKDLRHVPM